MTSRFGKSRLRCCNACHVALLQMLECQNMMTLLCDSDNDGYGQVLLFVVVTCDSATMWCDGECLCFYNAVCCLP